MMEEKANLERQVAHQSEIIAARDGEITDIRKLMARIENELLMEKNEIEKVKHDNEKLKDDKSREERKNKYAEEEKKNIQSKFEE